jgi:hypothetical protein
MRELLYNAWLTLTFPVGTLRLLYHACANAGPSDLTLRACLLPSAPAFRPRGQSSPMRIITCARPLPGPADAGFDEKGLDVSYFLVAVVIS